jgi:hypothetical protein
MQSFVPHSFGRGSTSAAYIYTGYCLIRKYQESWLQPARIYATEAGACRRTLLAYNFKVMKSIFMPPSFGRGSTSAGYIYTGYCLIRKYQEGRLQPARIYATEAQPAAERNWFIISK